MTPLGHAGGAGTGRISGPVVVVDSAAAIAGMIARELDALGATVRLLDGTATDVSGTLDDAVQQLGAAARPSSRPRASARTGPAARAAGSTTSSSTDSPRVSSPGSGST
jgi:hypothetical protein